METGKTSAESPPGKVKGRGRRVRGKEGILDAAAQLFYERGYPQTSIRAIAAKAGIESASLYYHFPSKEDILYAVEKEAFDRLESKLIDELKGKTEPWERLEVACITHVRAILENREYISVTTRELPQNQSEESRDKFLTLRDEYENIFRGLIDALPLNDEINRKYFRLGLIGALADTLVWYREGGADSPEQIALEILNTFRKPCDPRFM